jgi:hypothetical protein
LTRFAVPPSPAPSPPAGDDIVPLLLITLPLYAAADLTMEVSVSVRVAATPLTRS